MFLPKPIYESLPIIYILLGIAGIIALTLRHVFAESC